MLNFMQILLQWLGTALALAVVMAIWAVVIFIVIDEIKALIKGESEEEDDRNDNYL